MAAPVPVGRHGDHGFPRMREKGADHRFRDEGIIDRIQEKGVLRRDRAEAGEEGGELSAGPVRIHDPANRQMAVIPPDHARGMSQDDDRPRCPAAVPNGDFQQRRSSEADQRLWDPEPAGCAGGEDYRRDVHRPRKPGSPSFFFGLHGNPYEPQADCKGADNRNKEQSARARYNPPVAAGTPVDLARILLDAGLIGRPQLEEAERFRASRSLTLEQALIQMEFLTAEQLRMVLNCSRCGKPRGTEAWGKGYPALCNECALTRTLPGAQATAVPPAEEQPAAADVVQEEIHLAAPEVAVDVPSPSPRSTRRPEGGATGTMPAVAQDPRDEMGEPFGRYRLLKELGRGGMGVVWRGWDTRLKREVAIKQLLWDAESDPVVIERFIREAQSAARLQHPGIVRVYDVGLVGTQYYLTSDYVEGGTLEHLLRDKIPLRRALDLIRQIAEALHAAHEQGIIHRDVKPGNILMSKEGRPLVADFGLAKDIQTVHQMRLTMADEIMGTPRYMSPEQAQGHAVGPASDQFSVGVMLYEMVTGRPPFLGANVPQTLDQIVNAEPVPPCNLVPGLPRDVETICLKALEKDPRRRYGSLKEFAEDIQRYLEGEMILARPVPTIERIWRKAKKRRVPILAGLAVLATLVAWGVREGLRWIERAERVKQAVIEAAELEKVGTEAALKKAKEKLEVALALLSGDPAAQEAMNRIQQRLGGFEKARNEANAMFESVRAPLDYAVLVLYDKGAKFEELVGRVEAAKRRIEEVIARVPELPLGYYLLGRAWDLLGWDDRAESNWRKVLERDPNFGMAHYQIGRQYVIRSFLATLGTTTAEVDRNRPEAERLAAEAVRELGKAEEVIRDWDSELQKDLAAAMLAYVRGDRLGAGKLALDGIGKHAALKGVEELHFLAGIALADPAQFDEAIRRRPKFPLALVARAATRIVDRDFRGAVRDLDEALRFHPRLAHAWYHRGFAHSQTGRYEDAAKDFSETIRLDPKFVSAHNGLGFVKYHLRDLDGALPPLDEALRLFPDYAEARSNRALVRAEKQDLEGAMEDAERAVRLEPRADKSWASRAFVHYHAKRYEEAIRDLGEAIRVSRAPSPLYVRRSMARRASGDAAGARLDLDEALRLDPDAEEAYFQRALLRREQGDYAGAIEDLDDVVGRNPKRFEAFVERAHAHAARGHVKEALENYGKALELSPGHVPTRIARGHLLVELAEKPDEALKDAEEVLRGNPENAEALNLRGRAKHAKGDEAGAIADFTEALRRKEDYSEAFRNRGEVRMLLREFPAAIEDLSEALRLDPMDLKARMLRGMSYHASDDLELALEDLEAALAGATEDWKYRKVAESLRDDARERRKRGKGRPKWVSWVRRAEELMRRGEYERAEALLEAGMGRAEGAEATPEEKKVLMEANFHLACILALRSAGKSSPSAKAEEIPAEQAARFRDAAFEKLGKAVELGWNNKEHLNAYPDLAPLRGDDRWRALLDRVP